MISRIGQGPAILRATLAAALLLVPSAMPAKADTDWLTFAGSVRRNGYNPDESLLSVAAVPGLRLHWAADLGGAILTQPTLVRNVATAAGNLDLVFAATLLGQVAALDANSGSIIWQARLGVSQTNCDDFAASGDAVGVIGTPTIDLPNGRLLVVDGLGELHALDLGSGAEQAGFPLQIIDPANQAPRTFVYGSPTLVGSRLYAATASACDIPPAHGEIIAVDVGGPVVARRWFATPQRTTGGGGIWGPGGVSAEADGSAIYAATGNAFQGRPNSHYAEHVVALDPDLRVIAAAAVHLRGFDRDFGATPLPFDPPGCPPLLAAMNKSGGLFVYDRSRIAAGPVQRLQIAHPSSNGNFIGIPTWDPVTNALYLGSPSDQPPYSHGLLALAVGGDCGLTLLWNQTVGLEARKNGNNPVIPPTIADGVVWYADGDAGALSAFDAGDGSLLWGSGDQISNGILAAPTVANGQVFVAAFDHKLYAFGL